MHAMHKLHKVTDPVVHQLEHARTVTKQIKDLILLNSAWTELYELVHTAQPIDGGLN